MTMTLDIQDNVAHLHLDDGKANAVNPAFIETIMPLLDEAEAKASSLLLSGRPGRFSAGFDLKIMQGAAPEEVRALVDSGGDVALRLLRSKLPVIIACTGHGLAMGALLLLAADYRIGVAGDFKIGLNETQIGMVMPHFGQTLPKARLHPNYLGRAVINGELFDPQTAVSAGFLDEVADADRLMERARAQAATLGALPSHAFHGNKLAMRRDAIAAMEAKKPL